MIITSFNSLPESSLAGCLSAAHPVERGYTGFIVTPFKTALTFSQVKNSVISPKSKDMVGQDIVPVHLPERVNPRAPGKVRVGSI